MFLRQYQEVADALRSYESTRCAPWPANSFMFSVTDRGAGERCVLKLTTPEQHRHEPGPPHTIWLKENDSRRRREPVPWTSFAPPAGRRRSPRRPSTPPLCRSPAAPM
ncbi:hypothetical protein F9278_38620 [Streptomyces phaeolivaceus]|uniref:Uncharacterized protein n=1 Tax=Streptomyces phaeolivaceus TaxID=2653200 RepID=A0A5P8KDN6_9ACTN|nr:hypothetical protein F9278_38620 [Streptomyces phaeolivaceus]